MNHSLSVMQKKEFVWDIRVRQKPEEEMVEWNVYC